jgi:hypothetical protein
VRQEKDYKFLQEDKIIEGITVGIKMHWMKGMRNRVEDNQWHVVGVCLKIGRVNE